MLRGKNAENADGTKARDGLGRDPLLALQSVPARDPLAYTIPFVQSVLEEKRPM